MQRSSFLKENWILDEKKLLEKLIDLDIYLQTFQLAERTVQRTTNGNDMEIQHYQDPFKDCYMISHYLDNNNKTTHFLHLRNSIVIVWTCKLKKRVGSFYLYQKNTLIYKGCWDNEGEWSSNLLIEYTEKHPKVIEVNKKYCSVVYRGKYNIQVGERDGWGCEYDEKTGILKTCGYYENNQIVRNKKVFHDGIMTEYTPFLQVIYEGEYDDDYMKKYPRHGKGKEYDPTSGIVIWKGTWSYNKKVVDEDCQSSFISEISYPYSIENRIVNRNDILDLSTSITTFVTSPHCCSDSSITFLSFSYFQKLERIHIASNSFPFVQEFHCDNLFFLQSLQVDRYSFCHLTYGFPKLCKNKLCTINNNPSLLIIQFKPYAFSDFYQFSMNNLKSLKTLIIGDCNNDSFNFVHCSELVLSSLPSLQSVTLGRYSFQYQDLTVFENLPALERLLLGGFSLSGNPLIQQFLDFSRKQTSTLVLKNLPLLHDIRRIDSQHKTNDDNFLYYTRIELTYLPSLYPCNIKLANTKLSFSNIHDVYTDDCISLCKWILKHSHI